MSLAGRVPGTLPEKLLFRTLEERGITFMFSYYMGDIPMTSVEEKYRPDFILPDYNIIIDVFGTFWHSMQGKYQKDYTRALLLTAAGWKVHIVTDAEVMLDQWVS